MSANPVNPGAPEHAAGHELAPGHERAGGPARVLVIGGGIAGQAVCEQLAGRGCAITLVCGEPLLPYDRVTYRVLATAMIDAQQAAQTGTAV